MNRQADLIVHNARIYTVDSNFSIYEAMVIRDGKLLALGKKEDILKKYTANEVMDLGGMIVYPGFIDAHCHFHGYGITQVTRADLTGTRSFREIIDRLFEHAKDYPGEWIEGRGWDQNDWEDKSFPTKEMLDEYFPDRPVVLTRIDGHAILVNSYALNLANFDPDTVIEGGEIVLKNGEPTGILIDEAEKLIKKHMPWKDDKVQTLALLEAQKNCFAVGLTSVVDAGLDYEEIMLIDSLQKEGLLKMRMNCMLTPSEKNFSNFLEKGVYQTDRLKVNSVKLYADGALGSRGACLLEPYSDDPGHYGLIIDGKEKIISVGEKAYKHGYQVNTHAIGDSANRMVLDAYTGILGGKNDRRWRIEHAQIVHPDDFDKFGRYSIIPSIQTTHATSDMYWAHERLGPERVKNAYAFKQLLEQNGWVPNGTDFPVETIDPVHTFFAAVARKDLEGYPEGGFQMENALSREETLRSMTIWAAKSTFEEDTKGSLEKGKYADFVVMDKDLMELPEEEITECRVIMTFVGGEKVFGN